MEHFEINTEYIELIKLLKAMNWVASGGEAKMVVEEGLVLRNGEVEQRKRCKLRAGDTIDFQGQQVTIVTATP